MSVRFSATSMKVRASSSFWYMFKVHAKIAFVLWKHPLGDHVLFCVACTGYVFNHQTWKDLLIFLYLNFFLTQGTVYVCPFRGTFVMSLLECSCRTECLPPLFSVLWSSEGYIFSITFHPYVVLSHSPIWLAANVGIPVDLKIPDPTSPLV